MNAILETGIDWDHDLPPPLKPEDLGSEPTSGTGFAPLPGFAMNAANYKQVEKDYSEWLYRNQRADIFSVPALKIFSKPEETEGEFRARIAQQAREARDAAIDKLRVSTAKALQTLQGKLQTAEGALARQKAESQSAMVQTGMSILGGLAGALFGRKSGIGSRGGLGSMVSKSTSAYKQHGDVTIAAEKKESIQQQIDDLNAKLANDIAAITQDYDPANLKLETESVKPTRTDVSVDSIALLWLPKDADGKQAW